MAKRNILLVDDDPRHLRVMEVALRNAGYAVTPAADGQAALASAEAITPDLVIADTGLPGLDGFALCLRMKQHPRLEAVPFIFQSDDDSVESKVRGLELGAEDYLTHPIYTRELVARVRAVLHKRERARAEAGGKRRFYGTLGDMGVVDLIQTLSLGHKSGTIHIERPGHHATLWFRDGALIDASTGALQGEEAVYRALCWESGEFDVDFRPPQRPAAIATPTADLLMEGLRRVDEWNRIGEQLPPLDTVFEVDYAELSERLAELPDEANALLRLFDGRRTALDAIDDAALPDLAALALLSRLYFEGVIRRLDGPVEPAPEAPREPARAPARAFVEPRAPALPSLADALIESATRPRPCVRTPPPAPSRRRRPPRCPRRRAAGRRAAARAAARAVDLGRPRRPRPPRPRRAARAAPAAAGGRGVPAARLQRARRRRRARGRLLRTAPRAADDAAAEGWVFEEPARAGVPRAAWIALGLFGAAVVTAVLWFTLRDTVEPRPLPSDALHAGWHREKLEAQAPIAGVKPIEAEWRIPSEPGGGPTPEVPVFDAPPAVAAERAAAEPPAEPTPAERTDARRAAPAPPPVARAAEPRPAAPTAPAAPAAPAAETGADARALIAEGQALHKGGKYKAAVERYEKALALAPNNKAALVSYVKALIEVGGRSRDALDAAVRAERLDRDDAEIQLLLGNSRQEVGQNDAAIKAYERYLKLAPDGAYAAEVREIIKGLKRDAF
ncbi:MAG: DUF4388 domain-containing protein [Myxococcales bacterium]|nr:DUF4388 domain-containing protein [Myxococcales bacterium]